MGHSHISYRRVTPAAVADTLRLLGVEIVFLCVVCVANKAETPFWGFLTSCAKNTLPGVLFLLPALRHHIEALANADAIVFVCVCVCVVCVCVCLLTLTLGTEPPNSGPRELRCYAHCMCVCMCPQVCAYVCYFCLARVMRG